ncbi:MAG: aminotransferase class I/II-fold pyridoxal phosphate-dependent enzyme [Tunicatimonas sp.]
MTNHHPATRCVHAGSGGHNPRHGVNTPVYTSSAFGYLDTDENQYPRYYNTPNQRTVVDKLCALEQGEAGLLFGSGMAAISTTLLGLLRAGDHLLLQRDLYGGTYHFVTAELERLNIAYTLVDASDARNFAAAVQPNTRVVYVETPSNPLLKITDLRAVAQIAQHHGLVSVIDNTFASPINQNPLALGIDVVLHSGTKYLGGHSDLCFGAAITSAALRERIHQRAINLGGSINATTAALIERSLKTLHLRVQQQNRNAQALAEYLSKHPAVKEVFYPGLPSHPGHATAREQMSGFGGMLSFAPAVAGLDEAVALMRRLRLITPAISLGGVESLICSPAQTSHSKLSAEERQRVGVSDALLRVSVGIEDADDLVADLEQALGGVGESAENSTRSTPYELGADLFGVEGSR